MVSGFSDAFDSGQIDDPNDPRLDQLVSSNQIPLIHSSLKDVNRSLFHDITTTSEGIFTDTARGGLKKDLTAYFDGTGGPSDSDPIPDPDDYGDYGDLFGSSNQGFPNSTNNIPTWGQLKDWYNNELTGSDEDGTVNVTEDVGPVITGIRMHCGFSKNQDNIRFHIMPVITVWNPYDAGLSSQSYTIKFNFEVELGDFTVALEDGTARYVQIAELSASPTYADKIYNSTIIGDDSSISLHFTTKFKKGELKVFSVLNDQSLPSLATGVDLSINLEEGFDTDFPCSAYYDAYQLDPTSYTSGQELRYVARVKSMPGNIDEMTFSGGPFTSIYDQFGKINGGTYYDAIGRAGRALSGDTVTERYNEGRILHETSQFSNNIKGDSDISAAAYPAFPFIENTMLPVGGFKYYNLESIKTISEHIRVFANFNLGARNFGLHPEIEGIRNVTPSKNVDGYQSILIATDNISTTEANNVWDRNQTEMQADGSTNGFGLITSFYNDGNYLGLNQIPLRAVKRPQFKLLSIGQLQQVNVAPFLWQPGFTIGNSEANPYVDREAIAGITSRKVGGLVADGYKSIPNGSDNYTIDLSYLLNDALWDRYFMSGMPQNTSGAAKIISGEEPPSNSRIRVRKTVTEAEDIVGFDKAAEGLVFEGALNVNSTSKEAWKGLITAFRNLQISQSGVNTEINPVNTVPISRTFEPQQGVIDFVFEKSSDGSEIEASSSMEAADFGAVATNRDLSKVLGGFRYLTDDMVDVLAERIVDEVKLRGPFLSLADFVNRRLVSPDRTSKWDSLREHVQEASGNYIDSGFISSDEYDPLVGINGINGALQRAINVSGINGGINHPSTQTSDLTSIYKRDVAYGVYDGEKYDDTSPYNDSSDRKFSVFSTTGHYLDTEHLTGTPTGENGQLLSHSTGFITQGDLLSMIGSALTARGDTFLIRSYGDAINPATGDRDAKVWLETIVQRVSDPVSDSDSDMEPDDDFGRKFVIKSMRWLGENEI
jgi:hypothetical protein